MSEENVEKFILDGTPLLNYYVYVSANSGPMSLLATLNTNSYVATGLTIGNNYQF